MSPAPAPGRGDIVPIVLGGGERLLADVGAPKLEPVEVVASPKVTHVEYRVHR